MNLLGKGLNIAKLSVVCMTRTTLILQCISIILFLVFLEFRIPGRIEADSTNLKYRKVVQKFLTDSKILNKKLKLMLF